MIGHGSLAGLATLRDFERERLSSYDRTGGNADYIRIAAGETAALGEVEGAGCVKHTWMTVMAIPDRPEVLRELTLRIRFDGVDEPAVDAPLGDFHGVGFGLRRPMSSLPLQMSPQDGKAMNCWFPMPFAESAGFELHNASPSEVVVFFYIDYERYGALDDDTARFHARFRRVVRTAGVAEREGWTRADYRYDQRRTTGPGLGFGAPWTYPNLDGAENYVILDVEGDGQYVGCVLNVDVVERQVNDWYGEGDDMIFIDGERWPPRLHGTGTEDYFNTAFCPTDEFCAPYHGITVYSGTEEWKWAGRNSMYRFHVEDPVRFRRSIKVTIETGHANALANDYSSVAYWYQRPD
jgi:hypothetical protein